jgi:BASS family bile acid:Na+ symporter
MINRLNKLLEKFMPFLTPTAVLVGLLGAMWLHNLSFIVPWIFAAMTFAGSIGSNFKDLQRVLMDPMPIVVNLLILHLFMPILGWAAGLLFFPGDDLTQTGLVLLFVIPTGVASLVWITIYRGNLALTLALILLDTLISPIVVPLSLKWIVGAKVSMDPWDIMGGLLWMVVLPSLLGMLLNQWTKGKIKTQWGPNLAPFAKVGLFIVVAINSSVVAPYLINFDFKLLKIIIVSLVLAAFGYFAGWLVSHWMKWSREMTIAITINSGMRNLSAGAVLAISFFPPPVAIPVIGGMLFQQILAALFGQRLVKKYGVEPTASNPV